MNDNDRFYPVVQTPIGKVLLIGVTMTVERERELFGRRCSQMSTDKCVRAHDLINAPLSRICAPKCTVARKVRRRAAKNTVCEYSESCFTCPLSDCKQTVVKCLTVNRLPIDPLM